MPNTSYIALRDKFIEYGCFSIYQVLMWDPGFDSNNYTRWCRQGLLVRLRRGWFAFPEMLKAPDFARYCNKQTYFVLFFVKLIVHFAGRFRGSLVPVYY